MFLTNETNLEKESFLHRDFHVQKFLDSVEGVYDIKGHPKKSLW